MNEKDKNYPVDREAVHTEIRKGLKSILPKDHDRQPTDESDQQDSKEQI